MRLDSILIGTTATLVGLSNALKLPNNIYNDLDVERQIVENTKGYLTSIWTQNDENSFENKNAWDVIKGDEQFSKFTTIIEKYAPEVKDHIINEEDYTIFIPINDAIPDHRHHDEIVIENDGFNDPIPNLLGKLYDYSYKFDGDLNEDRKRHLKHIIEAFVMYHTIDDLYDVSRLHDISTVETLLKEPGTFKGHGQRLHLEQKFVPPATTINYFSKITTQDIKSKNAVIHAIDHVLLPPPSTINSLFIFPKEFSILTSALQKVGLADKLDLTLDGKQGLGSLTLFAPLNSAWEKLPPKVLAFLFSPIGERALRHLLEYHIVPNDSIFVDWQTNPKLKNDDDDLFDKKLKVETLLQGLPLDIELIKSQPVPFGPYSFDVKADGKSVVYHDGITRNGAVHVIGDLLHVPKHDHNRSRFSEDDWEFLRYL